MNNATFVILCFEGPDPYSRAGGLGSRVTELADALSNMDFETHLFFIGDPDLPGHEIKNNGKLHLHRWCQWISAHHRGGVYEGEEGKLGDWNRSLPTWLETELLQAKVEAKSPVIVLAEEWQTVSSIVSLHETVKRRGWQEHVHLLWNANNTFSFDRINWPALRQAAVVTTVSRYMKHVMWDYGVDARVVPNGISDTWLEPMDRKTSAAVSQLFAERLTLVKVGRWDPAKRWDMAIDAVTALKGLGLKPLLLARGGVEAHGHDVLMRAQSQGLSIATLDWPGLEMSSFVDAMRPALQADIVKIDQFLPLPHRRALFHSADAVLANSAIEPFGLVGLETMAVGGVAFVGSTGEDYVTPGYDAISIQSSNPWEIVHHASALRGPSMTAREMRRAARNTAARYTWRAVIERVLLPFLHEIGVKAHLALAPAAPHILENTTALPALTPATGNRKPSGPLKTVEGALNGSRSLIANIPAVVT